MTLIEKVKSVFDRKSAAKRLTIRRAVLIAARGGEADAEGLADLLDSAGWTVDQFEREVARARKWLALLAEIAAEGDAAKQVAGLNAERDKIDRDLRDYTSRKEQDLRAAQSKIDATNAILERAVLARGQLYDFGPPEIVSEIKSLQARHRQLSARREELLREAEGHAADAHARRDPAGKQADREDLAQAERHQGAADRIRGMADAVQLEIDAIVKATATAEAALLTAPEVSK